MESEISKKEKYAKLLIELEETVKQLERIESELEERKEKEKETEHDIDELGDRVIEITAVNKYIKEYLDRSLIWMIGIASIVIAILISIIGVALTIISSFADKIK